MPYLPANGIHHQSNIGFGNIKADIDTGNYDGNINQDTQNKNRYRDLRGKRREVGNQRQAHCNNTQHKQE